MKNAQKQNGRDRWIALRAQKWSEVLERFHRSGMTRRAFAEQEGVARATLSYWLTRERRGSLNTGSAKIVPAPGMLFGELKLGRDLAADSSWAMEVVSPTGLTVRSRKELSCGVLIRLLRGR
jgi:site-specific recombinase XerC